MLKIGDNIISNDFDQALINMETGENKEIIVSFPDDHINKSMAGKTITFKVKLNEIKEEILPEIDDDLAKDLGNFQSLEELKKKISDHLIQGYSKRVEHELNEQIYVALLEKTDFELPEVMVNSELKGIIAPFTTAFFESGALIWFRARLTG